MKFDVMLFFSLKQLKMFLDLELLGFFYLKDNIFAHKYWSLYYKKEIKLFTKKFGICKFKEM